MKKQYQSPVTQTIEVEVMKLMAGSVTSVGGNAELQMGGGGSGTARGRETDSWDDDY